MTSQESTPNPTVQAEDPLGGVLLEDKSKFKTCNQIGFYRRQKLLHPDQSPYLAQLDTLKTGNGIASLTIFHQETKVPLQLQLIAVKGNMFRLKIKEISPLKPRYEVPDVLVTEPATERFNILLQETGTVVLEHPSGTSKVHITSQPFSIMVTQEDKALIGINSQGFLYFEHLRQPSEKREPAETDTEVQQDKPEDVFGLWKEKFGDFVDIKANGPSSVGLDFTFYGFENVYGLPEHAENHCLKDTGENEAYRLYNLDVFGYRVFDKMGTYGSVPLLLAHKPLYTCGIFWLNASETLVEINSKAALQSHLQPAAPDTRKQKAVPKKDIRWMSESGIVDVFLLLGPMPQDVFNQYAQLTGTQILPPLFSLGYHQCRWNYEDEADVEAVDSGFDEHNIPYDVIWLDIEHTDGKRYFTWDPDRFPDPVKMQEKLQEKRRKLVVISDPHIKVDPNYTLYAEAKEKGYFVKDHKLQNFEGTCWPGVSSYIDFTNPAAREWYSSQFSLEKYKNSTDNLFVWNDMNEPSVFDAPEMTMPKNAVHHQGWEHRDLHNLYGFYQQMSTSEGLIQRSGGKERPFVLTRSFFAGSQRYGAVWTGDNKAEWEYLKISVPMLLSLSVTGIAFCGADVGGFVGDPDPELMVRWYQAGSFQPFFRGHAMQDTKRREPWLFGEENTLLIRKAIQERYTLLPYWYLLFYKAHHSAEPVMRPLWVEFSKYQDAFGVDSQYMLGNALLVAPVLDSGVTSIDVLFPEKGEYWYDFRKYTRVKGPHRQKVAVTLEEIPVFQRGGSIIPMYTTVGKSTAWMGNYPYELHVALDRKGYAVGELYVDDGHSLQYLHEHIYSHRRFTFSRNVLHSSSADKEGQYTVDCILEKVYIIGLKKSPSEVTVHCSGKKTVEFIYSSQLCLLSLDNLSLQVHTDWEIHIS
ncbi:neutral alpha-glucosidase C isoform X2 [Pyxicephalus adspersus]|uniref:neutral alpha-glucosidase C isoform X2 n=1 Tax=Pyxicephalus adspersus TaxID=30357 RepID=UPI003B5ABB16